MIDLNGTFLIEDPQTEERKYALSSGRRITLEDFKNQMDTDFAFALKAETISQALQLLHINNKSISIGKIWQSFDPKAELKCDNPIAVRLPNMQFDNNCLGDYKYPLSIDISFPEMPGDAFIIGDENKGGIVLPSVRVRAVRTDTNKVIMDFLLENLKANISISLDDMWNP